MVSSEGSLEGGPIEFGKADRSSNHRFHVLWLAIVLRSQ